MQVLLLTCGTAHLPQILRALQQRNALPGLWIKAGPKTDLQDDEQGTDLTRLKRRFVVGELQQLSS
jgi:hypothetical protein